jgi:hypothetical protein
VVPAPGNTVVGTGTVVQILQGETVVSSTTVVVKGDLTGNGRSDIEDAVRLVRAVRPGSTTPLPGAAFRLAADMNGDGEVDIADALLLIRSVRPPATDPIPEVG